MATLKNTATLNVNDEQVANGAQSAIEVNRRYVAEVTIQGTAPIIMHRWNNEAVEAKSAAAKNSAAKKTDDLESYVYRNSDRLLCIPGVNLHAAIVEAARSVSDPRSPRKAARDLAKAGIAPLTDLAPFEPETTGWDYEDKRRVTIQRSAITRTRPAMREGWRLTFQLLVNVPQYINETLLHKLISDAGLLEGLCDHRPTYGRFQVVHFEIVTPE